jgi:hypothetical protein
MLYDEVTAKSDKLLEWYYIPGFVIDKDCNCYVASSLSDSSSYMSIWSFGPDLKVRWVRDGLKFDHDRSGMAPSNDGNLYLWSETKHSLLKLSTKDGSDIQKIEGKPLEEDPYGFNMKGCTTLISDSDSSILAIVNNVFARFSPEGKRVTLWNGLKFGLFSSGKGRKIPGSDSEWAPYVTGIHSMPKRISGDFTRMNIGWDGYLYMIDRSSDGRIARFDRDGRKLKSYSIPLRYKDCMPMADSEGNMYILGAKEDSNTNLIKITSGGHVETLLTDIKEGGVLDDETDLALAPDGRIYIYKFYNRLKIFSPDMKMIFRSEQSKEDDEEVLKEKKEAVENDEEFS